jgi:hypothetical protein
VDEPPHWIVVDRAPDGEQDPRLSCVACSKTRVLLAASDAEFRQACSEFVSEHLECGKADA